MFHQASFRSRNLSLTCYTASQNGIEVVFDDIQQPKLAPRADSKVELTEDCGRHAPNARIVEFSI
jgi:hypothetical protein